MIEILLFIASLAGLGKRAQQRALNRTSYVAAAALGWLLFFLLGVAVLGPIGLLLRWAWLGGVYLFIERSHGGAKISEESWQCPDCRLFNDGGTLVCLCGYRHSEAPPEVKSPEAMGHDAGAYPRPAGSAVKSDEGP